MDLEEYRRTHFADPPPEPRFRFGSIGGVAVYVEAFDSAVAYYAQVLGPPAYLEGTGTRSWRIGSSWFTLLRGTNGGPNNVEIVIDMESPQEAERLQEAFIDAGGSGAPPSDQLMHEPVRYCPVRDPFGLDVLIISPRTDAATR